MASSPANFPASSGRLLPLLLWAALALASAAHAQNLPQALTWGNWPLWGDQGNETYQNPVLPSDYSDIDCIRVGNDYYAFSSTFQYSPGVVILHSLDMVNWTIIGHAVSDVTQISSNMNWNSMNEYGHGVWAGSIRYYNNQFWIYFGTPNEGYFMTTATNPAGPWAPLTQILSSSGWDDCCSFWDDNGQEYLIGTNYANNYTTWIYPVTNNGTNLVTTSGTIVRTGTGGEANKLYKINGTYYHLFSATTGGARVVYMQSASNVMGPYGAAKQLTEGNTSANQPNQGGLVQAVNGNWYFYTQHGTGAWEGRADSLLPVTWVNGWPIIGTVDANGLGLMAWSGTLPVTGTPQATPGTSDEFSETTLPQQWEWNYQPRAGSWSLTQRPGWLRLYAFTPLRTNDITGAGDTLTQRCFRTPYNQVITKLDLSGMQSGQVAGFCHFTDSSPASLAVVQSGTTRSLELLTGTAVTTAGPVLTGSNLWLGSTWGLTGVSQFSYSIDGVNYTNFGPAYQLLWSQYRGDRLALFSYNNLSTASSGTNGGWLDVDYFHYYIQPPAPAVTAVAGSGVVNLQWSQVREASGYQVNRAASINGPFSPIGPVAPSLIYTDTAAQNLTTYYYTVTTVPIAPVTSATSAVVSAMPVAPASINSPLLERLEFDETSGTTAYDSSGNGQNATLIGGPAFVAGKINNALSFSGSSQYAMLPAGVAGSLSGNFSITAWVYLNSLTAWQRICDFGTGTTDYMFLTVASSSGTPRFGISTGSEQDVSSSVAIPLNTWTHIALTVSGSTGTIYVNGVATGANTALSIWPSAFNSSILGSPMLNYLGKSQFSTDPYLDGRIDEFRIVNRAYSAAEIAEMASPPAAPGGVHATAGYSSVMLAWNTVSGAAGYNIRRSAVSGGPYTIIAENVAANSYQDNGGTPGTTYYYVVTTANSVVESPNSAEVSAAPLIPPAPSAPTGLNATGNEAQIALGWNAVSGGTGYNIYRSLSSGTGSLVQICAGVSGASYLDNSVSDGTTYYYGVTAVNSGGESPFSNEASATPSPPISAAEEIAPQLSLSSGTATVTISTSVPGHSYQLQQSATLLDDSWEDSGSALLGSGGTISVTVTAGLPAEFYRIIIQRE